MKREKRPTRSEITRKALSYGMTAVKTDAESRAFEHNGSVIYLDGDVIVRRSKDGKKDVVSENIPSAKKITLSKKTWKI